MWTSWNKDVFIYTKGKVKSLFNEYFGNFVVIYRIPLSEVELYWHGSVGTTELVLYREIKYVVSFYLLAGSRKRSI